MVEKRDDWPATRNPMTGEVDVPRPLTEIERALIEAILDARDFPGRDALREQIPFAVVHGYCTCGCATIEFSVHGAAKSSAKETPISYDATVSEPADDAEESTGLLLWQTDGFLSSLEIYSIGAAAEFPPPHRWELF
jgi:hypothetical protein